MNTKIYFENLAASATEKELIDLFSNYGNVADVHICVDRANDGPRSCGFVTMITPEGARAAIQSLSGKSFGTGTLTLSESSPETKPVKPARQSGPRRRASFLY